MVDRITIEEEMALANRLKREAETFRPEFSESLHGRIWRAVEDRKVPARQRGEASGRLPRWAYSAVAATLVIGTLLLAWKLGQPTGPKPDPAGEHAVVDDPAEPPAELPAELPALADVAEMTDRTTQRVGTLDSILTTEQWAHLDHDARVVTELLIDQLPFGLTEENGL